jgi:hypothetical protein
MLNVECSMLNVEWPPDRGRCIHSTFNIGLLAEMCGCFWSDGGLFSVVVVAVGTAENARAGGGGAFSAVSTAVLSAGASSDECENQKADPGATTEPIEITDVTSPEGSKAPTDSDEDPNIEHLTLNIQDSRRRAIRASENA